MFLLCDQNEFEKRKKCLELNIFIKREKVGMKMVYTLCTRMVECEVALKM